MTVIPLEKVILNTNIPTEDYSLSTGRVDELIQEQNHFKSQVAVDRSVAGFGSLLTLNTLSLPFQLNIAGVIVLSKD